MNFISKEMFIEIITFIKDRNDKQHEINNLMSSEFEDCVFWPYIKYESKMIKLLEYLMNDKDTQWISYFCWEKDFGRDCKLGDVTEKDGTTIPLNTAEDLWNLLNG